MPERRGAADDFPFEPGFLHRARAARFQEGSEGGKSGEGGDRLAAGGEDASLMPPAYSNRFHSFS